MTTLTKILVATDFSEASDAALAYGRELAARFNATLDVLHVAENIYITTFGAENYVGLAPDLQARSNARRASASSNSWPSTMAADLERHRWSSPPLRRRLPSSTLRVNTGSTSS